MRERACGVAALATQVMGAGGEATGVSSFGYSGTIAHAVVQAAGPTTPQTFESPVAFCRRAFHWMKLDAPTDPSDLEVHLERPGSLSFLKIRTRTAPFTHIGEEGALCSVQAAGLNFRDVLNVLGLDPTGTVRPCGGEASGIALAHGSEMRHLAVGMRVYGLAPGCLCGLVHTDARYLASMPRRLSFQEAVSLPVVWITAKYAICEARLMSGQNVLLHAAVGGIGLAAIEWLHRTCVSAIVTAGSRCKHALLRSLGLSKLASSRDPASFAQLSALQVRGRRLDGVLSALSNEFIPVSLGLLSEYGCFQEIGKNKIWSSERAAAAIPHVDYLAVAVDEGSRNCPGWNAAPWWMQAQLQALTRHADAGLTNPLPISSFRFANEAIWSALKLLQHGRNIGKVIIVVGSKRRTAPPMLPTPPPFAVPSTSVSRAADAAACARQLSALPHDTPCLIELDDIRIDSHGNLDAIVHGRRTPVLVLCRGALAGGGAMLLLDRATVVIGDQTASIPAAADLKRLGRRCLHSGTEPSWLDFVGTAAEARTEAQHLCRRLAQLPAPLLATCHTMLPAASTDAALLAMGSLHPRAPRQPGPRLVRVSMVEGTVELKNT